MYGWQDGCVSGLMIVNLTTNAVFHSCAHIIDTHSPFKLTSKTSCARYREPLGSLRATISARSRRATSISTSGGACARCRLSCIRQKKAIKDATTVVGSSFNSYPHACAKLFQLNPIRHQTTYYCNKSEALHVRLNSCTKYFKIYIGSTSVSSSLVIAPAATYCCTKALSCANSWSVVSSPHALREQLQQQQQQPPRRTIRVP